MTIRERESTCVRTVTVMTDIYELYIVKKELISDHTPTTIKNKTLSYKRVVAGQPCVLLLITTET